MTEDLTNIGGGVLESESSRTFRAQQAERRAYYEALHINIASIDGQRQAREDSLGRTLPDGANVYQRVAARLTAIDQTKRDAAIAIDGWVNSETAAAQEMCGREGHVKGPNLQCCVCGYTGAW